MFLMKNNKVGPALVKVSSSPSYTLAELRELSKEYLTTSPLTDTLTPELILSSLLAWLARKEREANEQVGQEDVG